MRVHVVIAAAALALTGCVSLGRSAPPITEYVEIRCPERVPVAMDAGMKPITCPPELEEWTGKAAYEAYLQCRAVAETATGAIEACGD